MADIHGGIQRLIAVFSSDLHPVAETLFLHNTSLLNRIP
jgi:hypothetical protein